MKCPICSKEIDNPVVICPHCGGKIRKSPATAAVLNFFFWGAGYLYCGRQWGLAILIPFVILTLYSLQFPTEGELDLHSILFANIPGFLIAWHAYKMAEMDWIQMKQR